MFASLVSNFELPQEHFAFIGFSINSPQSKGDLHMNTQSYYLVETQGFFWNLNHPHHRACITGDITNAKFPIKIFDHGREIKPGDNYPDWVKERLSASF